MTHESSVVRGQAKCLRTLRLLATWNVVVAAAILAGLLACHMFSPGTVGEPSFLLDVMIALALCLTIAALLIRQVVNRLHQRAAEARQRQLQAMSTMFRTIKHELNNDLQVVVGNAELAGMIVDSDQRASKPVESIREAATLATDRIQQLSVFYGASDPALSAIDLNSLLRRVVDQLVGEMPSGVRLRIDLAPIPTRVLADRDLLMLSLSHLIKMSARSLPKSVEIVVRTELSSSARRQAAAVPAAEIVLIRQNSMNQEEHEASRQSHSRDADQHETFVQIVGQVQSTVAALVEVAGAKVLTIPQFSNGCETLIRMEFRSVREPVTYEEKATKDVETAGV